MGRAIDQDNRLDNHERRIKLMEDALEEMIQTRVHHVDMHDGIDKRNAVDEHEARIRKENSVIEPDEEFTPPAGKRKKVTRKATSTT